MIAAEGQHEARTAGCDRRRRNALQRCRCCDSESVERGRLPGDPLGKVGVVAVKGIAQNGRILSLADCIGVTVYGRLRICSKQDLHCRPVKAVYRLSVSDVLTVIHDGHKAMPIVAPCHLGISIGLSRNSWKELVRLTSYARLVPRTVVILVEECRRDSARCSRVVLEHCAQQVFIGRSGDG
jgi:hypothetical protein